MRFLLVLLCATSAFAADQPGYVVEILSQGTRYVNNRPAITDNRGAGVLVDPEHVLTVMHNIHARPGRAIKVTFRDGSEVPGRLARVSMGLALIQLMEVRYEKPIAIGEPAGLGQKVKLYGFEGGEVTARDSRVTRGLLWAFDVDTSSSEVELGGPVVKGEDYARVDPSEVGFSPVAQLALVYGTGGVVSGSGSSSPSGSPVLASDTVSEALADAAEDPEIAGIIFRIDSPQLL